MSTGPALPRPDALRARAIALATLEAALSPEWEDRWFSWNPAWDEHEEMLEGRNGSGDQMLVLLAQTDSGAEAALNLTMHELGELPGLPAMQFARYAWAGSFFRTEPVRTLGAVLRAHTTDGAWTAIEALPGLGSGAQEWLSFLTDGPERYVEFAQDYYELEDAEAAAQVVAAVYAGQPLTEAMAGALAPESDWDDIVEALEEMRIQPGA